MHLIVVVKDGFTENSLVHNLVETYLPCPFIVMLGIIPCFILFPSLFDTGITAPIPIDLDRCCLLVLFLSCIYWSFATIFYLVMVLMSPFEGWNRRVSEVL